MISSKQSFNHKKIREDLPLPNHKGIEKDLPSPKNGAEKKKDRRKKGMNRRTDSFHGI